MSNGEKYVIGLANLQRDIPFATLVQWDILENAEGVCISKTKGLFASYLLNFFENA